MTEIQNACISFGNLLHFEYEITLAKKNTLVDIRLHFSKKDFFHLAGLQYLRDLPVLRSDRSKLFDRILRDESFSQLIQNSDNYHIIKDRVCLLAKLESLLDSDETVFKYNSNEAIFSKIDADFLLKNTQLNFPIFTFIKREDSGTYVCNSFFPQTTYDYSKNQVSWKVLLKKKRNIETGVEIVLFQR